MGNIPLFEPPVRRWECSHCNATDTTREAEPHTRFHLCSGLGITAPMVEAGSGARVLKNMREDYAAGADAQLDTDGKPVSSITTQYDDGHTDLVVLAPTAHAGVGA